MKTPSSVLMWSAFLAGRTTEAAAVDTEMRQTLFGIYGGEDIACWLSGLKYYMVRRRLFDTPASFLGYPLTDECRAFVERYASLQNREPANLRRDGDRASSRRPSAVPNE